MNAARRRVRSILATSAPRPARYASAWLLAIAILGAALYGRKLLAVGPFDRDWHATVALDLALNDAYCGEAGRLASGRQELIGLSLADDASLMVVPFPELLQRRASPRATYCEAIDHPFLNNENSTMLVMDAILRIAPRLTPAGLGRALTVVKLLPLALFTFVVLLEGAPPAAAAVGLLAGLDIQADLEALRYSIYGFLIPMLLLMTSLYTRWLSAAWTRRMIGASVTFLVAGFLTGFAANLRTSHGPVYAAMFLLYVALLARRMEQPRRRVACAVAAVVLFTGGYGSFTRGFITPFMPPPGTVTNYAHHPITHPLVLSLAIPPHPLAVRQGIAWDDRVGPQLAQRMIPDAVYLGRHYEAALLLYYVKLWMEHPSEMRDLYKHKFQLAGTGMFVPSVNGAYQRVCATLARLVRIEDGRTLLLIYALLFSGSVCCYVYTDRALAAALAFLGVAGMLLFLESAIIMSSFNLTYHACLLWISACTAVVVVQSAGEIALAGVLRMRAGDRAQGLAPPDADALTDRTIADFGEQWTTYVDNSGYYGSSALFDDVFAPFLRASDLNGKAIAEIGSGSGRWVAVFRDAGAAHVMALEPSAAIDVLRRGFAAESERVELIHLPGDRLPARGDRDYVFSIGVLHHIPDPDPVCRAAMGALKPGGTFGVWLYGREGNSMYLALFAALHTVTRRLPHRALALLSWVLGWVLDAYILACRALPLPLRAYATNVLAKLSRDKRRLVIYDQLNPAYAKYYTRTEAMALLGRAGFEDVRVHHRHGYSWTVVGRKPS